MDMCDDFAKFYPTKPVIFTKTERTFDTITKTGQDFLDSLPRRSMKLLQLKYFQTVCSLGSITPGLRPLVGVPAGDFGGH